MPDREFVKILHLGCQVIFRFTPESQVLIAKESTGAAQGLIYSASLKTPHNPQSVWTLSWEDCRQGSERVGELSAEVFCMMERVRKLVTLLEGVRTISGNCQQSFPGGSVVIGLYLFLKIGEERKKYGEIIITLNPLLPPSSFPNAQEIEPEFEDTPRPSTPEKKITAKEEESASIKVSVQPVLSPIHEVEEPPTSPPPSTEPVRRLRASTIAASSRSLEATNSTPPSSVPRHHPYRKPVEPTPPPDTLMKDMQDQLDKITVELIARQETLEEDRTRTKHFELSINNFYQRLDS